MKILLLLGRKPLLHSILITHCLLLLKPVIVYSQQWQVLGAEAEIAQSATNFTHITQRLEAGVAIPYAVFAEAGAIKVKKLTETSWEQVGNAVHTGSASYCRIYTAPTGQLMVTYVDGSSGNRLALRQFNPTSQNWEPLNNNANNLYLSEGSVTYTISQFASTPRSSLAFDLAGVPYVAFADGAGFTPFVKRFVQDAWETVGGTAISTERAVGINLAIDSSDNAPWVVYLQQSNATATTGPIRVFRLSTSGWHNVGVPNPINGGSTATGATNSVRHTAISFTSNWNPMIAYFNTGSNNRATTAIYNKATESWSLSAILSSRDAPAISLVRDAKANVYCSFADAVTNGSGRTLARVFMLPAGSNSWGELRNTETTAGVDEPAGNLSLSAGFAQPNPFIIYTKANSAGVVTPIVQAFVTQQTEEEAPGPITAPKQMEKLNRGLIAIRTSPNQVYVGWRLLGTDTSIMQFNVYANGIKVNTTAVATSTNFVHQTTENVAYTIRPVVNGEELDASEPTTVWMQPYLEINLQKPENGTTPDGESYSYTPNDCSIGDVDGDGQYEIFVKWEPTNAKDNSQSGYTGNVYIDCYRLNGTRLWRIDLGRNIRAGAHYTQFMVYDFDGDGKAEMACKTADGTKDGAGTVIGDALADHRNNNGYILTGPEFLTMFNGLTGAAMATVDYLPARGSVSSWGDNYGNRVDRFVAAVAYLDGVRPSLIMGRGYYTRLVRVAWDWRNGQFTRRWTFDSNQPGNGNHVGQGNHQMSVGDMDGDGRQEITNGSSTQNHNGAALWANGLGHGDALHLTDINPESPGLEMWCPYETPAGNGQIGAALLNAKTGTPIFTVPVASDDVGRALAADIDPRHKGLELWAARGDLYTATGVSLGSTKPSMNFAIWWDADTTRELLDGINITKWNWNSNTNPIIFTATGCASNNGTKATPNLSADLLGDWREEVIFRTADNEKLRIYTTTALTDSKFYTLMHDPQYRVAIAWQNSGYNQPPHPGFYLGTGMAPQPPANLYLSGSNPLPLQWLQFTAVHQGKNVLLHWNTQAEQNTHHFAVERSANARQFATIGTVAAAGRAAINQYQYIDDQPLAGISWYRIRQVDKDGKFTYSPTKAVLAENKHQGAQLYPNPLRKGNPIYYNGNANQTTKVNATVINAQGVILTTIKGNTHQINADLTSFMARQVPGIYFVKLMQDNEVSTVTLNLY